MMPLLHGAFELEWVDPFIDGIPGWGGLASPAVDWYDSPRPRVFTSSESEPGTVGVCMNNAWYAASTEGGTYAVFAEATGEYRVHLAQRQVFAWAGDRSAPEDWPVLYTSTNRSFGRDGIALGYPCLAVKRSRQDGLPSFALAWRGETQRELWAAVGAPWGGWDEVNVGSGLARIQRFCIAMDESLNTWLVFSAFDGTAQRIYLSVRQPGGAWSDPFVLSSFDDYTDADGITYEFTSVDFPSVAISTDDDPNGPTVVVVYGVAYRDGQRKRVLGRSARVADVLFAGWSIPIAFGAELDVGGSGECRDPCVAATRDGTFVVAWSWPNGGASIRTRYSTDLGVDAWSAEIEVAPYTGDLTTTQGTQNFASLSIDDISGRCLVCWEDTDGDVTENIATSNGAVAELADLTSWTPLGILTGHPVPTNESPSEAEIKAESTRYPCVVANMGRPQVFYRAVNDNAELVFRAGRWT